MLWLWLRGYVNENLVSSIVTERLCVCNGYKHVRVTVTVMVTVKVCCCRYGYKFEYRYVTGYSYGYHYRDGYCYVYGEGCMVWFPLGVLTWLWSKESTTMWRIYDMPEKLLCPYAGYSGPYVFYFVYYILDFSSNERCRCNTSGRDDRQQWRCCTRCYC